MRLRGDMPDAFSRALVEEHRALLSDILSRLNGYFVKCKYQLLVVFGQNAFRLIHALELIELERLDPKHISGGLEVECLHLDYVRETRRVLHDILRDYFTLDLMREIKELKRQSKCISFNLDVCIADVRLGILRCIERRYAFYRERHVKDKL